MQQDAKMDVKRLIMEVYKQPVLWDQKHVLYHNRESTNRIWVELSNVLKISKTVLKAKWKGLRDTFRAELKKELISRKSKNSKCKLTWVHYKHLVFLKEQMILKPPAEESNGTAFSDKLDVHSTDDTNGHVAKESSKRITNLPDVKVLIDRNIFYHNNKEIKINSEKTINQYESNLDSSKSFKNESKRPVRVKIASTRTLMYQKCDCSSGQDEASLHTENSEEDDSNDDSIEVKQEPIDNTVFQSDEHPAGLPQLLNENETLQRISSEQVHMTRTNDTNVELSIDQLEAHHLDDNYHFLMSLHPHIKTLPAERQMLLRIQMQELVYKEVYRKNTD